MTDELFMICASRNPLAKRWVR